MISKLLPRGRTYRNITYFETDKHAKIICAFFALQGRESRIVSYDRGYAVQYIPSKEMPYGDYYCQENIVTLGQCSDKENAIHKIKAWAKKKHKSYNIICLLYTSPSPRDRG